MDLRAFLHILLPSKQWETTVHREFWSLYQSWLGHRHNTPLNLGGLIHVGFEELSLDEAVPLVKKYPNQLLLTEAARWALPGQHVWQVGPVGIVPQPYGESSVYLVGRRGGEPDSRGVDARARIELGQIPRLLWTPGGGGHHQVHDPRRGEAHGGVESPDVV